MTDKKCNENELEKLKYSLTNEVSIMRAYSHHNELVPSAKPLSTPSIAPPAIIDEEIDNALAHLFPNKLFKEEKKQPHNNSGIKAEFKKLPYIIPHNEQSFCSPNLPRKSEAIINWER